MVSALHGRVRWRAGVCGCLIVGAICTLQAILTQAPFWVQSNGPFGGAVWALVADRNGTLYSGARAGTIFRYSTPQRSWIPLFVGATRQDVVSLAADQSGRVYFAAVNEPVFVGNPEDNSWTKLDGGPPAGEVSALAIDRAGSLLAAARSGLFRFEPGNRRWTKVSDVELVVGLRVQNQHVYAFGAALFHSANDGRVWTRVPSPSPNLTALAIDDRHIVYAGTRTGDVFRQEREGRWQKLLSFPNNGVSALEFDERGKLFVGLGGPAFSSEGGGVYVVDPGGTTASLVFQDNSNGVPELLIRKGTILAGTNEGVWRSTDGGSNWSRFNAGLIAQRINDVVIDRADAIYAGSYGGVFRSSDGGKTWLERNRGLEKDIGVLDMAVSSAGHLFVGTYLAAIYRSVDAGSSWTKLSTGIARTPGNWIMNLAVNSRNHVFACVLDAGLFRSSDGGDTWRPAAEGIFHDKCHALVVDSKDRVYAGNSKGDLFRSNDDGLTWRKLAATNSPSDDPSQLVVDKDDRVYFGGSEKGVYRFVEEEARWQQLNQGLPNPAIRSLLFAGSSLFAGTSGANDYLAFDGNDLFESRDSGANWSKQTTGLAHPRVKALAIDSKGVLFAGTWGGGVYRSTRAVGPSGERAPLR